MDMVLGEEVDMVLGVEMMDFSCISQHHIVQGQEQHGKCLIGKLSELLETFICVFMFVLVNLEIKIDMHGVNHVINLVVLLFMDV